ncbi:MAG: hypothetical protein RLZ55_1076 [Actinomycetota bacterium]
MEPVTRRATEPASDVRSPAAQAAEPPAALAPPSKPTVIAVGEPAAQVAANLSSVLSAPAEPGSGPAAPRPVIVLLSPQQDADSDHSQHLRAALDQVPDQARTTRSSGGRQIRLWIVALLPQSDAALALIDSVLDEPSRPTADAVVLVPGSDPAASALALGAWIRLRHDAPSNAFADMRDGAGRACRFAAVAAAAPSAAPPAPGAATAASGELAVLLVRRSADDLGAIARERAERHCAEVVAGGAVLGADVTSPIAAGIPLAAELADAADATLEALDEDDPAGLRAACAECDLLTATPSLGLELTRATMAVVEADAALRTEAGRTGFAARFGRRKRIEALTASRATALSRWAGVAADARVAEARADFGAVLRQRLDDALVGADARQLSRAADQHAQATSRWLTDVTASARGLQPPVEVRGSAMSRAWGRAVPAVRRYALVPEPSGADTAVSAEAMADAAAGAADDVSVHLAPGLAAPLVAALVMGLPLAAVDVR